MSPFSSLPAQPALQPSPSLIPFSFLYPAQSLATLTASGSPTNRSIVHRSFHLPISPPSLQTPSIPVLVSTTDVRSCKSIQISSVSPSVAISWWFPTPNAQFRIEGSARVVAEHDEPEDSDLGRLRKDLWQGMSGHLRATFARTRAPGSRMGAYDEGKGWPETLPTLEVSGSSGEEAGRVAFGR